MVSTCVRSRYPRLAEARTIVQLRVPTVTIDREKLRQLHVKYTELVRLRRLAASDPSHDPKLDLAALARSFPGALREIDLLPQDVLDARLSLLEKVLNGSADEAPWMEASVLFHSLLRGALAAKRFLAGRKAIDEATRAAFVALAATESAPEELLAWQDALADVAEPPRGRVLDLVFVRLAGALGTTDDEARALVFSKNRKR
jgi:hypothetical protein